MTLNKQANEAYVNYEYEKALALFQEAARKFRDVQSMNNLACFIWAEEEDAEQALDLLEETMGLGAASHFPYSLMGEIYTKQGQWSKANELLLKALTIEPTKAAYQNLAVANYQLGYMEEAAAYFLLAADQSDFSLYSHAKCLIEIGKKAEAIKVLDTFSEVDEEFVGAVDLADLYLEAGEKELAVLWFEKGWDHYYREPSWINRYVSALFKLERRRDAQEIIRKAIALNTVDLEEIKGQEVDEDWTISDKQEAIEEHLQKEKEYREVWNLLLSGHVPEMDFEPSYKSACYLFGCLRHNHEEYHGK
ncbi:tetratricopeptide repeat protein [Metaplanococcus flavidus]|uniref:Tetratricopeptide repeat protein n=1 Tax=Metaplanococcus flavidus TaxID=569883 RepID=A0ABW3L8U7_9BACL